MDRWREVQDAPSTLALCAYLGAHPDLELMAEVARAVEQHHSASVEVMLALGRMFLDAGQLAGAQRSLVLASRAAPSDPRPYRYLGEALLRRGDAIRAEGVLARAVRLGAAHSETQLWYERAVVYVALQKRDGSAAVATEVLRLLPEPPSISAPSPTGLKDISLSVME